jgi:hypothetical protein
VKARLGTVTLKVFLLGSLVLLPTLVCAEDTKYSVGLGFEFASGKYGTGTRTDSIYTPLTISAFPTERLDFSLEIPFIYQSSSAIVAGQTRGVTGQMMGKSSAMITVMGGSSMGSTMTSAASGEAGNTQDGLGDIKLKTGYVLYSEETYVPAIRPNIFVKFPTADKNRFLGTGAFDEGFAVELTKWFGKWFADGEIGYTIQGKSTIMSVKDYVNYYAGGGYQLSDNLRAMASVKGSSPTVQGASGTLEARLKIRCQLTGHTGIDGYLAKGIATASPDYGTGLAINYDF